MIKPSELTWDQIVQVGSGYAGGNYLRCFWWPGRLPRKSKNSCAGENPREELVLFRDLSGELTLLGAYCSHAGLRLNTALFQTERNSLRLPRLVL